jgi:putative DNA-binding protein
MKLLNLQRKMARAVMTPLTPAENMRRYAPNGRPMRAVAAEFIKPNDRLTSFERLEIYNKQYWYRVLASITDDFPGLCAVLGDRRFEAMAKAYINDCPSRSFTLRNQCSRLESWMRRHPRWAGTRQKLALDMVRLEWADIEVFDGKAEPPLCAGDVAGANPATLRLELQPYIRLLDLRYPVDDLALEMRAPVDSEVASNAFYERKKRKRVQAVARLKPSRIYLIVHRMDYSVYFRRLEREEFAILTALQDGKTLKRAVDIAFRSSRIPVGDQPVHVEKWFRGWAAMGWFCRPERSSAKS